MLHPPLVDFFPGPGRLDLSAAPIIVDPAEHESIHIAVSNLAQDFERVTGKRPPIWTGATSEAPVDGVILIGSFEGSSLIQELADDGTDRRERIQGKWESFHTSVQDCPWPFSERMLVIAGSDKRGTIFGVYNLSEEIGVSPWYWWADVPVYPRKHIFALPGTTSQGEPSVQYRGLFINDEAPALTDWVHEKIGPCYNAIFYKKFFELLLRMKANFFWPAMWSGFPEPGSSFFADDPANQQVAEAYGIVVSTSHHEPMQRSTTEWRRGGVGPWNWGANKDEITAFFTAGARRSQSYESIYTLGMRGEGDKRIVSEDPKDTLRDVIQTQRGILKDVYGNEDGVGQVMALYKEVQEYYEAGLEIPEDVTLLFADDNFGNIRRLPTSEERARPGGVGLYYHLEYVGRPRSYKWLNTNSCGKIQQQLSTAYNSGISKIWIFNVGDIKPLEMTSTLALTLAWNINSVTETTIPQFFDAYARREFSFEFSGKAPGEVSQLLQGYDRMMALRRHEHIEPETFTILNYNEAGSILSTYVELEHRAKAILQSIPVFHKAAFFQLVLHPIKASRVFTELRISQAKNQLYGLQRRNTTNALAQRVLALFDDDWSLSEEYHDNPWSGTKWRHLMKQPRYGYRPGIWHAPHRDMITGLSYVQRRQNSNRINGQMGVSVEGNAGVRPGLINEESDRTQPSRGDLALGLTLPPLSPYGPKSRTFEIYTRGLPVVEWTASASEAWVSLSPSSGRLNPDGEEDQLVTVTISWSDVPANFDDIVRIDVQSKDGEYEQVHLPVVKWNAPFDFHGFVESDGHVAVEPAALELDEAQQRDYRIYPYLGRVPAGAIGLSEIAGTHATWLDISVYFCSTVPRVTITVYFTMTLQANPGQMHCYDISLDTLEQRTVPLLESRVKGGLPVGWDDAVQDGVWVREHIFECSGSGAHRVRYRPLSEGLLAEKIVLDLGGVRKSYLGPPSSQFV